MADTAYERLLECPVCTEQYKDPKILQCHHTFCLKCLERIQEERAGAESIICPMCNATTPSRPDRLPHAFFIASLMDIYNKTQKEGEEQPVSPQSETDQWVCPRHNKELDVYCSECQELICSHCIIRDHASHSIKLVGDNFEHEVQPVREELSGIQEQMTILEDSLQTLEETEISFIKHSNEVDHQINSYANNLISTINRHREQLTDEVRLATQKKRKVIELQKQGVADILVKFRASHSSVKSTLEMGSQRQALASKQEMIQRLKMTRDSFQVDLLKPLETFDIHFNLDTSDPLKGLGSINCSHLHKKFVAKVEAIKCAKILSTALFKIELKKGVELPVCIPLSMIKVTVTPSQIPATIEPADNGCFNVIIKPIRLEPHHIGITIAGEHIENSPCTMQVMSHFDRFDVPMSRITITGPRGLCLIGQGGSAVAVSEYPQHAANEANMIVGTQTNTYEHFCILLNDGTKKNIKCPFPSGIAATSDGHILVVDKRNSCVRKFESNGKEVGMGTIGPVRQFRYLCGITVSREGLVAVTEVNSASVHILNPDLSYVIEIGGDYKTPFFHPTGITFDSTGHMYVTDCGYNKIFKLSPKYDVVKTFGRKEGQLRQPMSIATDKNDALFVTDTYNDRIAVFDTTGHFLTSFGNTGEPCDRLNRPCCVVIDETGKVYISDTGNDRVVVFN